MTVVRSVALPAVRELWTDPGSVLRWPCLFTLPLWLEAWSETLGSRVEPYLQVVYGDGEAIAVAPLQREGERLRFLGDREVCDYQDLVLAEGREAEAVAALWDAWEREGIRELDLGRARPASHVLVHLAPLARQRGAEVEVTPAGTSVELALPASWDAYLAGLERKQRHELRRKLRRLHAAGAIRFRDVRGAAEAESVLEEFFAVFRANRADKAVFLGPQMEAYFAELIGRAAQEGLLNLGLLEVGGVLAAATLCFDHDGRTHLYNNGYRQEYAPLNVGLLSKVLSLRDSLERGMAEFDLLAGDEDYKLRLGGKAVPLSGLRVER